MNSQQNIAIEAATDGACSGNPGPGGWGGLIIFNDNSEIEIGGSEENTTNNRMELTAAIKTLEKLRDFQLKENFKLRTVNMLLKAIRSGSSIGREMDGKQAQVNLFKIWIYGKK